MSTSFFALPPPPLELPLTNASTAQCTLVLRTFNHAYKSRFISHVLFTVPSSTLLHNSGDSLAFALPQRYEFSISAFTSTSHLFYKYLACCFLTLLPPASMSTLLSTPSFVDPAKSIKIAAVAKPLKDLLINSLPDDVNLTQGPEHTHELHCVAFPSTSDASTTIYYHSLSSSALLSPPTPLPFDPICRSYHKLSESFSLHSLLLSSASSGLCLDIGSAPGGWSQCLLRSGAKSVIAVDPGNMDIDCLSPNQGLRAGSVTHVRGKLEDSIGAVRGLLEGEKLDCVVCDANVHPLAAVSDIVCSALLGELVKCGAVVNLTVKLTNGRDVPREVLEEKLREGEYEILSYKWLFSNGRKERNLVCRRV